MADLSQFPLELWVPAQMAKGCQHIQKCVCIYIYICMCVSECEWAAALLNFNSPALSHLLSESRELLSAEMLRCKFATHQLLHSNCVSLQAMMDAKQPSPCSLPVKLLHI